MKEEKFIHIDRELAAFITRLAGGNEDSVLGKTVCELSAAVRSGGVCIEVSEDRRKELLAAEKVVGQYPGEGLGKILLLDNDLLYFQKMLCQEIALAGMFLEFPPPEELSREQEKNFSTLLDTHYGNLAENQKIAVRQTLVHPFSVISGGPGTGKTTVGSAVLFMAKEILNIAPEEMLIMAPTGKAHMRLRESLRGDSSEAVPPMAFDDIAGGTIHKMLGWNSSGFSYNKARRLPYRLILVDECSMISQNLMRDLLSAVAPGTRLVLLGDAAQLASIDAGNVFADLCQAAQQSAPGGRLYGVMTNLKENFRAKSAPDLIAFADSLREGKLPENHGMISKLPGKKEMKKYLQNEISVYREMAKLCQDRKNMPKALKTFDQFRIICAVNGSQYYGVAGVNEAVLSLLELKADSPGVPVMIRHNDYEQNLFNGDTGIIGPDQLVYFPGREEPVVLTTLPEYDIAYAITAHKSQGSGYRHVQLLLPPDELPLLSRELIYTAVTRARQSAKILGDIKQIEALLASPLSRRSKLAARLLY